MTPETAIIEEIASRHAVFGDVLMVHPRDLSRWRAEAMATLRDQLGWTYAQLCEFFGCCHAEAHRAVEGHRRRNP